MKRCYQGADHLLKSVDKRRAVRDFLTMPGSKHGSFLLISAGYPSKRAQVSDLKRKTLGRKDVFYE